MRVAIPGLRGSVTHRLSVEVFQRHRDGGSGYCRQCDARMPCAARQHAAEVITAAGEEPTWYDRTPPSGCPQVEPSAESTLDLGPGLDVAERYVGFAVGGHGRRADVPHFAYER